MRFVLTFVVLLTAILVVGCAPGASSADADPAAKENERLDPLDPDRLEAALRYLAADELLGRRTGTPGNAAAAAFIARRFEAAGLTPPPGEADFFQPIPFVYTRPAETLALSLGRVSWSEGKAMLLRGDAGSLEAEVVFVGYGTEAIDYADAAGRVAVARVGTPGGGVAEALGVASEKRARRRGRGRCAR